MIAIDQIQTLNGSPAALFGFLRPGYSSLQLSSLCWGYHYLYLSDYIDPVTLTSSGHNNQSYHLPLNSNLSSHHALGISFNTKPSGASNGKHYLPGTSLFQPQTKHPLSSCFHQITTNGLQSAASCGPSIIHSFSAVSAISYYQISNPRLNQ